MVHVGFIRQMWRLTQSRKCALLFNIPSEICKERVFVLGLQILWSNIKDYSETPTIKVSPRLQSH